MYLTQRGILAAGWVSEFWAGSSYKNADRLVYQYLAGHLQGCYSLLQIREKLNDVSKRKAVGHEFDNLELASHLVRLAKQIMMESVLPFTFPPQ